jgi:hypothetical protein
MEDYRKDFICIMAGYTEEMDTMLGKNPGLHDRIQFYIDFPDYSAEELLQIFRKLCREKNYSLEAEGEEILRFSFQKIINNKSPHFPNARLVRKLFERVQIQQAIRTENLDIISADIQQAFHSRDITSLMENKDLHKIGFAV